MERPTLFSLGEGLEEAAFKLRLKVEKVSLPPVGKSILGRENSTCKGPKAELAEAGADSASSLRGPYLPILAEIPSTQRNVWYRRDT